jgi:hypothetical protein
MTYQESRILSNSLQQHHPFILSATASGRLTCNVVAAVLRDSSHLDEALNSQCHARPLFWGRRRPCLAFPFAV